MLIVISPAKKLDFDSPVRTALESRPVFPDETHKLVQVMQQFSAADLAALMKLSDSLARLNAGRYGDWVTDADAQHARQAVLAFNGDVYDGLAAGSLSDKDLLWAQDHLAILSGLYGVLRPLDLIQPHRLEMGTRLATSRGKNLYQWWGDIIAGELNRRLDDLGGERILLNLASAEYFRAANTAALQARVVECVFQDQKNGDWKVIGFHAKKARGMMARYIICNRIRNTDQLQGFDHGGYKWAPEISNPDQLVFRRAENVRA